MKKPTSLTTDKTHKALVPGAMSMGDFLDDVYEVIQERNSGYLSGYFHHKGVVYHRGCCFSNAPQLFDQAPDFAKDEPLQKVTIGVTRSRTVAPLRHILDALNSANDWTIFSMFFAGEGLDALCAVEWAGTFDYSPCTTVSPGLFACYPSIYDNLWREMKLGKALRENNADIKVPAYGINGSTLQQLTRDSVGLSLDNPWVKLVDALCSTFAPYESKSGMLDLDDILHFNWQRAHDDGGMELFVPGYDEVSESRYQDYLQQVVTDWERRGHTPTREESDNLTKDAPTWDNFIRKYVKTLFKTEGTEPEEQKWVRTMTAVQKATAGLSARGVVEFDASSGLSELCLEVSGIKRRKFTLEADPAMMAERDVERQLLKISDWSNIPCVLLRACLVKSPVATEWGAILQTAAKVYLPGLTPGRIITEARLSKGFASQKSLLDFINGDVDKRREMEEAKMRKTLEGTNLPKDVCQMLIEKAGRSAAEQAVIGKSQLSELESGKRYVTQEADETLSRVLNLPASLLYLYDPQVPGDDIRSIADHDPEVLYALRRAVLRVKQGKLKPSRLVDALNNLN